MPAKRTYRYDEATGEVIEEAPQEIESEDEPAPEPALHTGLYL